jgi:endonuclease IV
MVDDVKIVIEIPAFTKDLHKYINDNNLEHKSFIIKYLNTCIDAKFDIVLDTAHLYANGLGCNEMCELIDQFKSNFEWLHLNGNSRPQFTTDMHTYVLADDNKFKNEVDVLLKKLVTIDCICILESINYKDLDTSELDMRYGFKNLTKDLD